MKTSKRFLVAAMLIATSFTFIGCSGDDGSDGKDGNHGTNGADGAAGADGADGSHGQSCNVEESGAYFVMKCGGTEKARWAKAMCRTSPYDPTIGVCIGTQVWLRSNLNVPHSEGNGNSACYDDDEDKCAEYGRLYDWSAAMNLPSKCNTTATSDDDCKVDPKHQGLCPSGWHIPTDAEWTALTTTVGTNPGTKLKASSDLWETNTGTDDYGFSALPGGYGSSGSSFSLVGNVGNWWSATENGATEAQFRDMFGSNSNVNANNSNKSYLCSVRCVQD
jgi:uncharacterized protein (TIGR02145 family)